jgi:hypothetical protein
MSQLDVIQTVLARIEQRARQADQDDPYKDLLALPELPMDALRELGTLTRGDMGHETGALPSLVLESSSGLAQIEVCPFGPLALISSDGDMNTDPVAQTLMDAEITPLFPGDLDGAALWHGAPLSRWLFPRLLRDALALFDELRSSAR